MNRLNRRAFLIASSAGTALLCAHARAQLVRVDEAEPKAVAVGYRHDTRNVDQARYPKHDPSQNCENCLAFYPSDDETEEWGECDLMSDRLVYKGGWCSSYKPIKA